MTNLSFNLIIPQEHPCFADHFPGSPLVPGALLLAWISEQLQREHQLVMTHIKQAKFLTPVLPGMTLSGELTLSGTRVELTLSANAPVLKLQGELTREHP